MSIRERIFQVIEPSGEGDRASRAYDIVMIAAIVISLVPLAFKETNLLFDVVDYVAGVLFLVDYVLRLCTADLKLGRGRSSFLRYPFTPMAIIDLVSLLPFLSLVWDGLKVLRVFRLVRALRVLRVLKAFRYSRSMAIVLNVIKNQKEPLLAVCALAFAYVLVSALVVFNVEPETFENFFEAIYWAMVSLTTVGYGDIYPVTTAGRVVTMLSSFVGIAIIALPSGIITAGYMDEIQKEKTKGQ